MLSCERLAKQERGSGVHEPSPVGCSSRVVRAPRSGRMVVASDGSSRSRWNMADLDAAKGGAMKRVAAVLLSGVALIAALGCAQTLPYCEGAACAGGAGGEGGE